MQVKRLLSGVVALGVLAGAAWLVSEHLNAEPVAHILYGNVEIRQVDLAFNSEGKLIQMNRQEGDPVSAGETIALLDPATYEDSVRLATARRDAAQAQLEKLVHGTRQEDIDQARANVAAAKAALANADVTFRRQDTLARTQASPQQAVDDARRVLDTAQAQLAQTAAALAEAVAGHALKT